MFYLLCVTKSIYLFKKKKEKKKKKLIIFISQLFYQIRRGNIFV